jgi:signal transduction histidine kinase
VTSFIEDAAEQTARLVRLRWIAIVGVASATAVASVLDLVSTTRWLGAAVVLMVAWNAAVAVVVRGPAARPPWAPRLLAAQLAMDMLFLTGLLHLSGGIENPFAFNYVFLVMLASLTCSRRAAYAAGGLALFLFAAMGFLEYLRWLPHHHVWFPGQGSPHRRLFESRTYFVGMLVILGSTMAGVVAFTSSTVERLRMSVRTERSLRERIDQQERLAIIGEAVAVVVHELSSPLNGVRNAFRALRRDPGGFLKREGLLELMEEALDRMASISRRLLMLSRDPQIDRQHVVVNEVIERSLADFQHRLDAAGVSLECRLAPGLRPISADRIAVGEVVTNLVSNALDAVEGGGRVTVETSNGQGAVEIRVIDTGRGIPTPIRARLFQPFQSTKPAGKGTGLGLAISKRLVEVHGGTIVVDSRDGEGTTVTVRLPAGEGIEP